MSHESRPAQQHSHQPAKRARSFDRRTPAEPAAPAAPPTEPIASKLAVEQKVIATPNVVEEVGSAHSAEQDDFVFLPSAENAQAAPATEETVDVHIEQTKSADIKTATEIVGEVEDVNAEDAKTAAEETSEESKSDQDDFVLL